MFGGVEQLIRDSQDWVYRDQAQFANGFDNWTGTDVDPAIWANGVVGDGSTNRGAVGPAVSGGMGMSNGQASMYGANGNNVMNGYPGMDWVNGSSNYNHMALYNEDEWYQ